MRLQIVKGNIKRRHESNMDSTERQDPITGTRSYEDRLRIEQYMTDYNS